MATTKEIFVEEIQKQWDLLRQRDDTIFENIEYTINAEGHFEQLKENNDPLYMELFHENSLYEKKKLIRQYFWDNIVGDLFENTIDIMKKAGLLEEALESFDKSYKIENTARLILENGIFAFMPANKKKELTENIITIALYPSTYIEENTSLIDVYNAGFDIYLEAIDFKNLQENWLVNSIDNVGSFVTGSARFIKNLILALSIFLISPATVIAGGLTKASDESLRALSDGKIPQNLGLSPTARKIYQFLDNISPVKWIYDFLNKDLIAISQYLQKTNNLEDPYIQEILSDMGANRTNIIKKCWDKNKHQVPKNDEETRNWFNTITNLIKNSGKALANAIRNPLYRNENQLSLLLKFDAADPKIQKMFYDFRICVYDKLFEIIIGYAKAIYSINDSSYEIIKAANEAHKQKNYKAFFKLHPKELNEEAMFNVMKALVAIDDIANTLAKRKDVLVADRYIDKFIDYLRLNIKHVYNELEELANQKKYNVNRYKEEDPDEETKAKIAKEEAFNRKKSIFEM